MADDVHKEDDGDELETPKDSGSLDTPAEGEQDNLGNLPPLSDFDSKDTESDSDLPPMEENNGEGPLSGLPPIIDIKVDTPAVRPSDLDTPDTPRSKTPAAKEGDFASPAPTGFDTPGEELDTPEPPSGPGFQDFAADSDFSPETPEIGPGPDSDIETPMFDSAFGADSDEFGAATPTPAPTQAMETPMFESQQSDASDFGFDADAFGAPTPAPPGADAGTPVPDFSPDTGAPPVTPSVAGMGEPVEKRRSGIGTFLIAALFLLVGLAGGLLVRSFVNLDFLPNPLDSRVSELEGTVERQVRLLEQYEDVQEAGGPGLTLEEREELLADVEQNTALNNELQAEIARYEELLAGYQEDVRAIQSDIEVASSEFVTAQELLDDLKNEMAITEARYSGLLSENERLEENVGALEEANKRRLATRDTLLHNLDLLEVQIEGGSPLTPNRYARVERLNKVQNLRGRVEESNWVTPAVLDEYTELYLAELDIAASREYFFARIPVRDELGVEYFRWAECLMNGNWSVYFRTLDGRNVGVYENVAAGGPPDYRFREDLPSSIKSDIGDEITAARGPDFEQKMEVLLAKQRIYETESDLQRNYSSL